MDKFLYPPHPHRVIITGPSGSGKTYFLANLILNISNDFSKLYIYSPSIYQELYQKLIKCLNAFLPLNVIQNLLNQNKSIDDLEAVIEEIIHDEDFESSEIEIETFDSIKELKDPEEFEPSSFIILDDLGEKDIKTSNVQAMFERTRPANISVFVITQDYYELPKRTVRANGSIFHIFKPNNFRDVQHLHQDKASMDMTYREFKELTSICWNEKYQPLTIDMTRDKFTGRYRLGLCSIFVPNSSPF